VCLWFCGRASFQLQWSESTNATSFVYLSVHVAGTGSLIPSVVGIGASGSSSSAHTLAANHTTDLLARLCPAGQNSSEQVLKMAAAASGDSEHELEDAIDLSAPEKVNTSATVVSPLAACSITFTATLVLPTPTPTADATLDPTADSTSAPTPDATLDPTPDATLDPTPTPTSVHPSCAVSSSVVELPFIDLDSLASVECLDANCTSGPVLLPFPIYQQCGELSSVWVSPFGFVSETNVTTVELSSWSTCPDGAICPFLADWQHHNQIYVGAVGTAPERIGVISWIGAFMEAEPNSSSSFVK